MLTPAIIGTLQSLSAAQAQPDPMARAIDTVAVLEHLPPLVLVAVAATLAEGAMHGPDAARDLAGRF